MKRFSKEDTDKKERIIAYFSMEIGLTSKMPTYSGGLGVLAGDTIKSSADLNVPTVAVSLIHEEGYFYQELDKWGNQYEKPVEWHKENFLKPLYPVVTVKIEGRDVSIRAWEYIVQGEKGHTVPVILLDTNIDGNNDIDRGITKHLYGGDQKYRLCQEIVLGIGGVKMLKALGYNNLKKYHMNEGHAALLTIELLKEHSFDTVRKKCVFTTHTPVPAGHDRFYVDLVRSLLPDFPFDEPGILDHEGKVNMTLLALHFSHYVNGVAKKHGEVSREMFPGYSIDSITNGVHSKTWISPSMAKLYDHYVPGWNLDPFCLRYGVSIPRKQIMEAHFESKKKLIDEVNHRTNAGMNYNHFTIGFARRAARYKRADLLFSDIDRLKGIAEKEGHIQIIYAGKAHPHDEGGKDLIRRIFALRELLGNRIKLVYLQNYDMDLAKLLVSGVDVWLNTPLPPKEASGTSGMKAAHNGVPSFSIMDGWWIEGCIEHITGWEIKDVNDIYNKLENKILPTYYKDKGKWVEIMRHTIAINASFFNTHRMVQQYVLNAYFH